MWTIGDDIGTFSSPPSFGQVTGTVGSWESSTTYSSGAGTTNESGNDTSGYSLTFIPGDGSSSSSGYGGPPIGLEPASEYQLDAYDASQDTAGNATGGSLLATIQTNVGWAAPLDIAIQPYTIDRITPVVPSSGSSYVVTLNDGRADATYAAPLTVIIYRGGVLLTGGSSGTGFNATGDLSNGTAAPNTDSATPGGMPWQAKAKLNSFVENVGTSDGVARNGPLTSTPTLTAIAAPGRNPADITIPILTGGEGSGEEDDVVAGGSSGSGDGEVSAMGDAPSGGHEVSMNKEDEVAPLRTAAVPAGRAAKSSGPADQTMAAENRQFATAPGTQGTAKTGAGVPTAPMSLISPNFKGGNWTPQQKSRIMASLARVRARIPVIIKQIDEALASLSPCEREMWGLNRENYWSIQDQLNGLKQVLQKMLADFDSGRTVKFQHYVLPKSVTHPLAITTPGIPFLINPEMSLSDRPGADGKTWEVNTTDAELDALMLHELSHIYRTNDLGEGHPAFWLYDAAFLEELITNDLATRLKYTMLKSLAQTKCQECGNVVPPEPDRRNFFFP